MNKVFIFGVGGFAREVEAYHRKHYGIIDGFITDLKEHWSKKFNNIRCFCPKVAEGNEVIVAVGSPIQRKKIVEYLENNNIKVKFPNLDFSYPGIKYEEEDMGKVEFGDGSVLCPGTFITTNVKAGKFLQVNVGVLIGHDVTLGNFVTISPHVIVGGNSVIKDNAYIGMNVSIVEGNTIGKNSIIGAGAVVANNIPDNVTAVGVPAKVIKIHGN